jgi:autotransporter-associated beta strand protein
VALAGTGGLNQNGNGTLVLVQPAGYTGGTTNNAGTLELLGSLSTYSNAPLAINSGIVESAATLNLDVDQNNDSGSTNVIGAGLLRLVGTTNSSSSPDLYFDPDAFEPIITMAPRSIRAIWIWAPASDISLPSPNITRSPSMTPGRTHGLTPTSLARAGSLTLRRIPMDR